MSVVGGLTMNVQSIAQFCSPTNIFSPKSITGISIFDQ